MKRYLLLLTTLSLLTACHKNTTPAPRLPPFTTTGANVMACEENGVIFEASGAPGFGFFSSNSSVFYTPFSDYMYISGNNASKKLVIQFDFKDSVGSNPLLTERPLFGATFYDGTNTWFTDATHGGTIDVLYYQGTIMSGKFSFDAVDSSGNVVHITDGEFDING